MARVPDDYSGRRNRCIGWAGRPEMKIAQDYCRTVEHSGKPSTLPANDEAFELAARGETPRCLRPEAFYAIQTALPRAPNCFRRN